MHRAQPPNPLKIAAIAARKSHKAAMDAAPLAIQISAAIREAQRLPETAAKYAEEAVAAAKISEAGNAIDVTNAVADAVEAAEGANDAASIAGDVVTDAGDIAVVAAGGPPTLKKQKRPIISELIKANNFRDLAELRFEIAKRSSVAAYNNSAGKQGSHKVVGRYRHTFQKKYSKKMR